ncbi:MAG TPA: DNA alkylation repair protein [Candidatus Kryptonia bacterium]
MDLTNASEILSYLRRFSSPENVAGMARFGISKTNTLGVSIPVIRDVARKIGTNHSLALELWETGIHEARLLAGFVDDPERVTNAQMEKWVKSFDSWDVCDQVCSSLFDETRLATKKVIEWSKKDAEFVKRAGFVLMAALAVHNKEADDKLFLSFLPIIKRGSSDDRNFVRKAVNWALRQIGKRNLKLNRAAVKTAKEIQRLDSKSAKWIASDALRELTGEAVLTRLKK